MELSEQKPAVCVPSRTFAGNQPRTRSGPIHDSQISPPNVNTTTKAAIIQGIEAKTAGAVVEKVVDLRTDQKSFFVNFMAMSRIIQPTSAQIKREHLSEWKKRKRQNWSATLHGQDLRRRHFRRHPHSTIQPSNPRPPSPTTHTQTIGPLSHQLIPNHSHYPHLRVNSRLRKNYLRLLQAHPQSKSLKAPKLPKQLHSHPSA